MRTYLGLSERISLRALVLLDATTVFVANQRLATNATRCAFAFHTFRRHLRLATGQTIQLNATCVEFFIFVGAMRLERHVFKRDANWT